VPVFDFLIQRIGRSIAWIHRPSLWINFTKKGDRTPRLNGLAIRADDRLTP
jgi:hypothetical protein